MKRLPDSAKSRALRNARVRIVAHRADPVLVLCRVLRYRPLKLDGVEEVEIGLHVHKRFWNQGVATEAATMACATAAGRFEISRLIALVHPEHVASRLVAEHIRMRAERTALLDGDYPAVVYAAELPGRHI